MTNSTRSINDRLLDRERVNGASRMIPEGTPAAEVSEEAGRAVAHAVDHYAKARGVSRKQIARAIGYRSPGVISEFVAGTYRGNWRQLALDLDAWLADQEERDRSPRESRFVWTSVAKQVRMIAGLVTRTNTIGMVFGPESSGIGKTMALRAVHSETPGSILVTVEKVHNNPTGLLRAIAQAMHVSDGKKNSEIYNRIKGLLKGTPRLLMIDQIHNLRGSKDDKPLYILADLWDATAAPQLWCGTADMQDYLRRGQRRGDEPLAQIRSRIQIAYDLADLTRGDGTGGRPGAAGDRPLFSVDDIRQAFGSDKMRLSTDGARYLCGLANVPEGGALRTVASVVRLASLVAEQVGEGTLTEQMLRDAFRLTLSTHKFELAAARLEEQRPTPMRAVAAG